MHQNTHRGKQCCQDVQLQAVVLHYLRRCEDMLKESSFRELVGLEFSWQSTCPHELPVDRLPVYDLPMVAM